MKALTLTQPWAMLVAIGAKRIETRSWKTDYRGPLAIHAAKMITEESIYVVQTRPFYNALEKMLDLSARGGFYRLPLGFVIATCELMGCVKVPVEGQYSHVIYPQSNYGDRTFRIPPFEPELSFGNYTPGRYAWLLCNIKILDEPVPCKGSLGLWDWEETR